MGGVFVQSILIYDLNTPFPYDHETLEKGTLGGTEATVVRVAEKLAETFHVVVIQGKKTTHTTSPAGVQYVPYAPFYLNMPWHAVIVVRIVETAITVRSINPTVPIWLWAHDLLDIRFLPYIHTFRKKNIGMIFVSDFLMQQLKSIAQVDPFLPGLPEVVRIYNPIDDALVEDDTPVDSTKLLFASSFQKGLYDTIRCFTRLREIHCDFKLFVTNPGYNKDETLPVEGVTLLGPLSHHENIQHMRSSLALFQLNHVHPETFGLVLAEANAVGTPILTHPLGAATEVLENKVQLINTFDKPAVIERILEWRFKERPKVHLPNKFRLSEVIKDWLTLLN
jgi:glycosyltransferase involved in cell wall biosynthesis